MSVQIHGFYAWVLPLLLLASCSTEIIHDVEENEANEILAALQQQGVSGEKLRNAQGSKASYTVKVSHSDAVQTWQVLRQENLPRPKRKGLGEIFGNPGLVPTATQERAMIHHALAGELSKTLQSVEGVLEAHVHLVLPSRDPLAPPDVPRSAPRASVLLRIIPPSPLEKEQVQKLVAGSVDGLDPQAVSVIILAGNSRRSKAAGSAALAQVGPFWVADRSKAGVRAIFLGGLVLIILLGAFLLLVVRRHRSLLKKARLSTSPLGDSRLAPGSLGFQRDVEASLNLVGHGFSQQGKQPSLAKKG